MKINYKTKKKIQGSISLLLVIILLPMMTFSAIIVDLSRINMAKQMMSSAGDLAMNTALANYDTILKDVYGLFAMSQQETWSNKTLSDKLTQYFAKTISDYGVVTEEESEDYVNALIGDFYEIVNGVREDPTNFLTLSNTTVTATKVEGSSLANASVLRKQIVEYMKYRAPLGVGLSFLESITAFEKVDSQNAVVEAQVAAQESTQDVTQASKKLIKMIRDYDVRVKELNTALTGVTGSTDKNTIPLEDYDSHPMKYLSAWKENYTHINKLNLVFQANTPSADNVYLKNLNYSTEPFVDYYGVVTNSANIGFTVEVSLAGNTEGAKQQINTQIANLDSNYAKYQKSYANTILYSGVLSRPANQSNNIEYYVIKPENEATAIKNFTDFEKFLLNQTSDRGITYAQVQSVLKQILTLDKYLDNFIKWIDKDISAAKTARDNAYRTWEGYNNAKNSASGAMRDRITYINNTINGYLGNQSTFTSVDGISRYKGNVPGGQYVRNVLTALPARNVSYESYYKYNIGNGGTSTYDKYIECVEWLVYNSGLSGKTITAAKKVLDPYRNRGAIGDAWSNFGSNLKKNGASQNDDLYKILTSLMTCHAYALTYQSNISKYNTNSQKADEAWGVYTEKKGIYDGLVRTKSDYEYKVKNCLNDYHTLCQNYQTDAYYYKYYIKSAQNTIAAEAKAIQTHFSSLLTNLNELKEDLNEIATQVGTVKSAISTYNDNLDTWSSANNTYNSANGKDSFSSQSAEDVEAARTTYDEKLYDTLETYMISMWSEFDDLYSKLTEAGNFVYGTKRIDAIATAKDLKDALTGQTFSQVVTVEEATQKLATLYKASTEEYIPFALDQVNEAGVHVQQLCFLEEIVVPLQALRYLNTMYPEAETTPPPTTTTDGENKTSTEDEYNTAKDKMSGKSDPEDTEDVSEDSGADFGYTYTERTVSGDLPSGLADSLTKKREKVQISTEGSGEEEKIKAKDSVNKQSQNSNSVLKNIGSVATAAVENLYILNYLFENFSYSTILQEQMLEDYKDDVKGETIVAQMTSANTLFNNAEKLAESKKKSVTLSNWEINPYNNYLYGAELEYILFGNTTPKTNVTTAKASIYAIRFAFNCIYAFTDSEIRNTTMAAGLAVQAATLGIVPYQIVQIVLQLALAAAESALDLAALNYGLAVAVIKTKDTWCLSAQGAGNVLKDAADAAASAATEKVTGLVKNGIGVVTDGLNSVLDAGADELEGALTNLSNDIGNAAKGVMESAVDKVFADVTTAVETNLNEILNTRTGETLANGLDKLPTKAQILSKTNELFSATKNQISDIVTNACGGNSLALTLADTLTSRANDMVDHMKDKVVQVINNTPDKDDISTAIATEITNLKQALVDEGEAFLDGMTDKIASKAKATINEAKDKVQGYIDQCGEDLSEQAAEAIKKEIQTYTDEFVNSTLKISNSSAAADVKSSPVSMFKFSYKNYLMLLTYISICVGDSALLRTADVIQMNLDYSNNEKEGGTSSYAHPVESFQMSKAYTYISITAEADLDMFFMDMSLFQDQVKDDAVEGEVPEASQGSDGTTHIVYKGLLGY